MVHHKGRIVGNKGGNRTGNDRVKRIGIRAPKEEAHRPYGNHRFAVGKHHGMGDDRGVGTIMDFNDL